jgi:hypothetical protein
VISKRSVLKALNVRELQQLASAYDVQATDKRSIASLTKALARSHAPTLAEILHQLSRSTLKNICGALGLSDSGKEKIFLINRILKASKAKSSTSTQGPTADTRVEAETEAETAESFRTGDQFEQQSSSPSNTINVVINNALLRLTQRAELIDRATLVRTFVDTGVLTTLLTARDHQIIYGRRGTGKTHALLYLADTMRQRGDATVYVDMRLLGSTGGLHSDPSLPVSERATRLLIDTLAAVHGELSKLALEEIHSNLTATGPGLYALGKAISEIRVQGNLSDPSSRVHRVHFGSLGAAFTQINAELLPKRLWVILDEWSVLPLELQPYLADLLRRALLPIVGITVKIAAIEHRSRFKISTASLGDYIGMELGADISANLNLDDFMVFDNDAARATAFFRDLLFRHFQAVKTDGEITGGPANAQQFIAQAFTQRPAFDEVVVAAEGVPRDAINILGLSAQRAAVSPISILHVRDAARTWYQRDKDVAASANREAKAMLDWIIDEVIGHRRTRAFLLRSGTSDKLIDALFDARVLHVLKRGIATHDQPGVRYDVFKIDYGCYVDLIATKKATLGLLAGNGSGRRAYVEVPPDDYRAIRRAILDLTQFVRRVDYDKQT